MANFFKDWFFNQLPKYHQRNDTLLDGMGNGLLKRYLRTFGMELDEEFMIFLDNFLDLVDVIKTQTKHLPLLGGILGYPPSVNGADDTYRKILAYAIAIYKVKGTLKSFQILFNLLGLEMDIIEVMPKRKVIYDDVFLYDDDNIYDSECDNCSGYYIQYNSASDVCNGPYVEVTSEILVSVNKVICLINPINAVFLGLIRRFKVCDTMTMLINDLETNFCSIPTGIYGLYNTSTNIGTIYWSGSGDFEIQYRLLGNSTWIGPFDADSGYDIEDLDDNEVYEVQIRRVCGVGDYSNWVTSLFFTDDGIINETGHTIHPSALEYIKNSPHIDMLTDYEISIEGPIFLVAVLIDGIYVPGTITINNANELKDWLNTLDKGTWSASGNSVISYDNIHTVQNLFYSLSGNPTEYDIWFRQYGQRAFGLPDIIKSDIALSLDFGDPIHITAIRVNGTNQVVDEIITTQNEMRDWLNTLSIGTFDNVGDRVVSVGNSNAVSSITYTIDSDEVVTFFEQRNVRIGTVTDKLILTDYLIGLDPVDVGIQILFATINGLETDGPVSEMNSADEISDWLNTINKGVFTASGNGNIQSLANKETLDKIKYVLVDDLTNEIEVLWNQRNQRIINFDGVVTTVTIDDDILNNEIWENLLPVGLYDKITLKLPIGDNPTQITGGQLLTQGSSPYIGFIDGTDLVFINVTMGTSMQIIVL